MDIMLVEVIANANSRDFKLKVNYTIMNTEDSKVVDRDEIIVPFNKQMDMRNVAEEIYAIVEREGIDKVIFNYFDDKEYTYTMEAESFYKSLLVDKERSKSYAELTV
jgi:hypothetical protein